jgi:hypothetical protein
MTADNILKKFKSDKEFVRKYQFALNELGVGQPGLLDRVLLRVGIKVPLSLYRTGTLDIIILGSLIFAIAFPINLLSVFEYRSTFFNALIKSASFSALFAVLFAILLSYTSHKKNLTAWKNI